MKLPAQGDVLEVEIDGLDDEGRGRATLSDDVHVAVRGAFPGDRARAKIERVFASRGLAVGRALAILDDGPVRAPRVCPHAAPCPGCPLEGCDPAVALELKRGRVETAFAESGLGDVLVEDPFATDAMYGARQKVKLTAGGKRGALKLGVYVPYSHVLVDADRCAYVDDDVVAACVAVRKALDGRGVAPAPVDARGLKAVVARTFEEGVGVVVVTGAPLDDLAWRALVRLVEAPLPPAPMDHGDAGDDDGDDDGAARGDDDAVGGDDDADDDDDVRGRAFDLGRGADDDAVARALAALDARAALAARRRGAPVVDDDGDDDRDDLGDVEPAAIVSLAERVDASTGNSLVGGEIHRRAGLARLTPFEGGPPVTVDAFCQADPELAVWMYEECATWLVAGGVVGPYVDAYAGTGGFARALRAAGAPRVVAIERAPASAAALDASDVEAWQVAVEDALPRLREGAPWAGLILDPPKKGLGVLAAPLAALGAPRVVLVACDPDAAGRDARVFRDAGYDVERVVPVDMFPGTPEVETLVFLAKARP